MSLKAFHVIFITACILLALGLGAWEVKAWSDYGSRRDLVFGVGSLLVGVGLVVYECYFLKKLRNVSYL
jgi:hypothetical protein